MAGRTKGDFLNYANRTVKRSISNPVYETVSNDNDDSYGRDETTWGDIQQTDAGYDGSVTESGSDAGTVYGSYQGYTGRDQSLVGAERSTQPGVYDLDTGGDGTDDNDGFYDIPVRNYQRDDGKSSSVTGRSTTRIIKKRTNALDNMFGKVGNLLHSDKQPRSKAQKAVEVTQKLLTLNEYTNSKPVLIKTILWSSQHLDDGLEAITKGHRPVTIWRNIQYDDAEILAEAFLDAGRKSVRWAGAVRQVLDYEKKVKLGIILIPRAAQSIMHLFTYGIDIRMDVQ